MLMLRGPCGTAELVDPKPRTDAQTAALATWFLTLPDQSPLWSKYVLSVIHLRPIPGVKPPVLDYPGATHELLLVALDPERKPTAKDPDTWRHLVPINVCVQFDGTTDAQAAQLAELAARALVDGVLFGEPQGVSGAAELWVRMVRNTAEHLATGGHRPNFS